MPSRPDPNLGLHYGWTPGESGWNVGMDANLRKLGAVTQLAVLSRETDGPDALTASGSRYIVPPGASGPFAGHDGEVAVRVDGEWTFYVPAQGWLCRVADEDAWYEHTGSGWQPLTFTPEEIGADPAGTAAQAVAHHEAASDPHPQYAIGDLSAIAQSLALTGAVDVCVYDTRQDSDGGAWRHRCQHTSWYNEPLGTATRGLRREFPAVALIVARTHQVTIYDATDPELPMWRVFNQVNSPTSVVNWWRGSRNAGSVAALNGRLYIGLTQSGVLTSGLGLLEADFAGDNLTRWEHETTGGGTGLRVTEQADDLPTRLSVALANQFVNDVALTVLPDAPADPVTGLPVPTVAVATDGGVSVIRDDGVVVSSAATNPFLTVDFTDDNRLVSHRGDGTGLAVFDDYRQSSFASRTFSPSTTPAVLNGSGPRHASAAGPLIVRGTAAGLDLLHENPADPAKGMVAYVTRQFCSGWLPGDIRGAWLADTEPGTVVGEELVENPGGPFTTTDSWLTENAVLSVVDGRLRIASDAATPAGRAYSVLQTVPGQTYVVEAEFVPGPADPRIAINRNGAAGLQEVLLTATEAGIYSIQFTATTSQTSIIVANSVGSAGDYSECGSISIRPAIPDRSVKSNGLVVHGTITAEPVAEGAELVAYSGFSAENYLEGSGFESGGFFLGWQYDGTRWVFATEGDLDGVTETAGVIRVRGTMPKALLRYTMTVPSEDQLAHIEAAERRLFEPGAKCTLPGDSDSVTALAYDDATRELHVITSYGRSTFRDLLRVGEEATAVGAPIAADAGGGRLALAGSTGVEYREPAITLRDELGPRRPRSLIPREFRFDGDAAQTDFYAPHGWKPVSVYVDGALKRQAASGDYTVLFDGFRWFVRFAVAPGAGTGNVALMCEEAG